MSEQPFKVVWQPHQSPISSDPLSNTYNLLQQAETLRMQRQFDRARAICEPLVNSYPDYFGALYTLGLIYADIQKYPQALGFLVRASMLNPQSWQALTALSAVYLELGASEMAAHTLEQAIALSPQDPGILLTLGEIYREEREYELALEAYRRSFSLDANLHVAGIGLGTCYAHLGQYAQAAEVFERLLAAGVHYAGILNELNHLPRSYVSVDILGALAKYLDTQQHKDPGTENLIAFIRAAALDRAGQHREAWQHLVPANRHLHMTVEQDARELAEMQRLSLTQLKNKTIKPAGDAGSGPLSLFILGPSRSGKTTLESLVATLDGVKRGYENPSVEKAIRRTFQSAGLLTSGIFEALPPQLDSNCRDIYLKELARRAGSAKVFTNTHPGRIHDAARVASAFPRVRFVFVKRNLDDNMLRIYMRDYMAGNPYANDLRHIRDHISWYHEMIDTLAARLPAITRVVHYERMVDDPAGVVRSVADLCSLPMHDRPLPAVGDDRGCAEPYRQLMTLELAN